MKKKFLGIVCIIYSSIIFYVLFRGYLKNFLAPHMQKYIIVTMPVLLVIGLVIIISKENSYRFKFTDLILLLPIVMLINSGNGRLSTSLATNRSNTFKKSNVVEKKEEQKEVEIETIEENDEEYDFTNVDFEIEDSSYQLLSDLITYNSKPDNLVGKTIRVRGFTLMKDDAIPKGYFGVGKYIISCCVADAGFGGFIAKSDNLSKIKKDTWYEVEGVLKKGKDGYGNVILYIDVKNMKTIPEDKEELYVYPCYAYGDGTCEALNQIDIEF